MFRVLWSHAIYSNVEPFMATYVQQNIVIMQKYCNNVEIIR